MKALVFAIVTIAMIGASRVATAQVSSGIVWSTPMIGCYVANTTTAHPPAYDYIYGEVDFVAGDTGTYHLVCSIPSWGNGITNSPVRLDVRYNYQPSIGCSITGALRYHSLTDGTYGTLAGFTGVPGTGSQFVSYTQTGFLGSPDPEVWDSEDNTYWLDFTVSYTGTSGGIPYCAIITADLFGNAALY